MRLKDNDAVVPEMDVSVRLTTSLQLLRTLFITALICFATVTVLAEPRE